MKNKEFDKIFKDKLSDSNLNKSQADWEVFSQLLKNEEGFENIYFDKSIQDKLNHHTTDFNPSHWQVLHNRILKEEFIRKRIFLVKSMELLSLLLLFIGYISYENHKFQNTPFVFNFDIKSQGEQIINKVKDAVHNTIITTPTYMIIANQVINLIDSNEKLNQEKVDVVLNSEVKEHIFRNDFNDTFKDNNLPSFTSHLNNRYIKLISNRELNLNLAIDRGQADVPSTSNKSQKFVGGLVSLGIGITKSSYDKVYNLKAYEAYDNQQSIGITYGKKNGNIEYSTGLKYTRRANEPAKVVETYGDFLNNYYEISLNKITYNIVEVPLSIKYLFDNKGKTNYYVKAGVNANLSLHNTYTITNKPKYVPLSSLLSTTISISDDDEINGKAERSKLNKKDFSPGVFKGGSIKDNYFMTASIELGMERKLTKNNTLFVGAEYSKYYMIDGIGPNKEKLNNLSVNLGLKHYIN